MNIYYKVKWGDTLEKIANKYHVDVDTLACLNRVNDFYIGKIIKITNYNYHISFASSVEKRTLQFCLVRHSKKGRYYRVV